MRRQDTRETGDGTPIIGGSSLFVIFAVLCLTVFALLSLSTVRADQSIQQASVRAVTDYYAADRAAEEVLSRLRTGQRPQGVAEQGEGHYTYTCPISDRQQLAVEVLVTGETYTVLRWQAVSTLDWQADEALEVWNGGSDDSTAETEGD